MKTLILLISLFSFNSKAALSESVCGPLVVAEIKKINPSMAEPEAIIMWTAICKGILDHIKADGETETTTASFGVPTPGVIK